MGAGRAYAEASAPASSSTFPHHGADAVVDVVESGVAHEGWGRDHLVLLVHVSLVHTVWKNTRSQDQDASGVQRHPAPQEASPSCPATALGRGLALTVLLQQRPKTSQQAAETP